MPSFSPRILTPAPCSHFNAVSAIQRSIETNHHHRNKNLAAIRETFRSRKKTEAAAPRAGVPAPRVLAGNQCGN